MLHFNRNDIHEWNISKEVFDAMIKDYGFKIDESKISIEALYTNALANLRNDAEKSFKFLKQEKSTAEEIRDQSFEEKTKIENFFTNALMIEVAKIIQDEKFQKHVLIENLKKANLAYLDFLHRHSNEVNARILADVSLQEQADMLMQEQQLAFEEYKDDLHNTISNCKAKLDALRQQREAIEAQIKEESEALTNELYNDFRNYPGTDGEPLFKDLSDSETKNVIASIQDDIIESDIEINEDKAAVRELDEKINIYRRENISGNMFTSYRGSKEPADLHAERKKILDRISASENNLKMKVEKHMIDAGISASAIPADFVDNVRNNSHFKERSAAIVGLKGQHRENRAAAAEAINHLKDKHDEAMDIQKGFAASSEKAQLQSTTEIDKLLLNIQDLLADHGAKTEKTENRASIHAR